MMSRSGPVIVAETIVKAGLSLLPGGGAAVVVLDAVRGRVAARAQLTIEEITEIVGVDRLAERLLASSEFEALFVSAVENAIRTGYEAKRRLQAKVVANAALDDARVEESQLITQALRDLDGPHLRALERIRIAEDSAVGEQDDRASLHQAKREAANQASAKESEAVRAVLVSTGAAAPGSYLGGGIGIAYVSDFGRRLLEDLRAADTKAARADIC